MENITNTNTPTEIQTFFYSKVGNEVSPFKKTGFHVIGYPVEYLSKKEILELESYIHYPGGTLEKKTIFWRTLKNDNQLVIIYLTPLLDAKDEFGRKGMFMAQGFIFPSQIWKQLNSPKYLYDWIQKHLYKDSEALFRSPEFDASNGNLKPLYLSPQDFEIILKKSLVNVAGLNLKKDSESQAQTTSVEATTPIFSHWCLDVFYVIYKIVIIKEDQLALVLKGMPEKTDQLMNEIWAFLPNEAIANSGWDTGFDGGKIFFYPLKIVGYTQNPPVTGEPLVYDCDEKRWLAHPQNPNATHATHLYERWVSTFQTIPNEADKNLVYRFCQYLNGKSTQYTDTIPNDPNFFNANNEAIRILFAERMQKILPHSWLNLLQYKADVFQLTYLLMNEWDKQKLAEIFTNIVLNEQIPLSSLDINKGNSQADITAFASQIERLHSGLGMLLKVSGQNLAQNKITPSVTIKDFENIPLTERYQWLAYLLTQNNKLGKWFWDIIGNIQNLDTIVWYAINKQTEHQKDLQNWLAEQVNPKGEEIKKPLAQVWIANQHIPEQEQLKRLEESHIIQYLEGFFNGNQLTSYLAIPKKDFSEVDTTYSWLKKHKNKILQCPQLEFWLAPDKQSPAFLNQYLQNPSMRISLLETLMRTNPRIGDLLVSFGYSLNEISEAKSKTRKGIFSKIKSWLS